MIANEDQRHLVESTYSNSSASSLSMCSIVFSLTSPKTLRHPDRGDGGSSKRAVLRARG